MLYIATGVLAFALPYVALAFAGALLWRRLRSVSTLMVALGFAAAFAGQLMDLLVRFELNNVARAQHDTIFIVAHYHAFPILTHYIGLFGLWVAAVGLVRYARRGR